MNQSPLFPEQSGGAVLSSDGLYRYQLTRTLTGAAWPAELLFIMLNPSTADALTDDPTVRKCIGFARRWGYGVLHVGNLFAYRSPYPSELLMAADPVGPDGDRHLERMLARADRVVLAWGSHTSPAARRDLVSARAAPVLETVSEFNQGRCADPARPMWSVGTLGRAACGAPSHPLMLAYDTPFLPMSLGT
jgi:hypothetical protein